MTVSSTSSPAAASLLLLTLLVGPSSSQCPTVKVSKWARQELLQSQLRFSSELLILTLLVGPSSSQCPTVKVSKWARQELLQSQLRFSSELLLLTLLVGPSSSQCPTVKVSKWARQELLQSQLRFSSELLLLTLLVGPSSSQCPTVKVSKWARQELLQSQLRFSSELLLLTLLVGPSSSQCPTVKVCKWARQELLQSQLRFSSELLLLTLLVGPSSSQCPTVKVSKWARQELLQSQLRFSSELLLLTLLVGPSSSQCPTVKVSKWARQELLQSQLQFSVDFLQNVGELRDEGNVFFSPSSVYNALLLAYFASANQTEESLRATLRFPDKMDKSDIFGAYSWERTKQSNRAVGGSGKYRLSSVNRMYISDKENVLPCIEKDFKNEIVMADLTTNVSTTVAKINKFVSENTNNEINDFLSSDSLNENTNLVLVNAAYFRGLWTYPFSPDETRSSQFSLANGTTVPVTMMSQENQFNHWIEEDLGVEVLELPYKEADISMFILLPLKPSSSAISELLNKTDSETLLEIFNFANETSEVTVNIPKFMVDQTLDLTPILEAMGVGDLFQPSADLSSLTGEPGLTLDKAIHKAKVVVDEVGTTAAAATAIFANRFAADVFFANHPFVYFIFDKKGNTLLFAGIFSYPET